MLLKYLDIQGFKSFPDKTRVAFDKGLTAVVGPNGSGKSNISDAVRWVMGEQSTKTLRGDKMEDVIFSGTKARKSQGFAEVSLTVDNSNREFDIDSDDVTITRKYYRSGESEYMINRANVRLKDINELFMDTGLGKDGYSLVGQGKIAEIVRSKSNERREIFEEAAGISKFRYRKNESERSLQNAEENLVRLRDILSELEGRIEPLKEQSEKAKKFIELSDGKKVLEVSIWNDIIEKSNQSLKDQSDKILISNSKREELEKQIEEIEQNVQSTFMQMQGCLVEIEDMRRERSEIEEQISQLNSQVAVCQNDILHNEQNVDRIDSELENHETSSQDILLTISKKEQEIVSLKSEISVLEESVVKKQDELLSKSGENESLTKKQQELSDSLNQLILQESQIKMQITQSNMLLADLGETIEKNTSELAIRENELVGYNSELSQTNEAMKVIVSSLESLNNSCTGHKLKLDNKKQKLDELKADCDKSDLAIKEKQQKAKLLEGLEKNLEGFNYSVKEVLKRSSNGVLRGVLGSVSQIIGVKPEYSTAIEIALGSAMQNIIVENEGDAKAAIKMLQQQNLGRATFLPITSVNGSTINVDGLDRYAGYVDTASNLVDFEPKFKGIIESLLGRTVIVDDIDTAVMIAQKNNYKFRIVTLDGQVVNAGGSLTGGSKNKTQGLLSRKNDIAVLHDEIAIMLKKHNQNLETLNALQNEVSLIKAEFNAVNSEILTLNEDKIRLESEQKRISHMVEQINKLIDNMKIELDSKSNRYSQVKVEIDTSKAELEKVEANVQSKVNELQSLELTNKEAVQLQIELGDAINAVKISIIEKNKDIEAVTSAIDELKRQHTDYNQRVSTFTEQRESYIENNKRINEQISSLNEEMESLKLRITNFDGEISVIMEKRNSLEEATTKLRRDEREITEQKEKMSSETVRLEERHISLQREFDEIIQKLWDEYELTRTEAQNIAVKLDNTSKANSQLNSIKSKIRSLGSVNVAAIEEFKEVSERYEFLNAQVNDALKSKNELLKLINELTQKMEDIFRENFNKINEHFKEIFVELFGGGRADLKLTEPDNILESGIEIFVEPPGKIIKNLASLSGGEQAFIAIAIYFAILKVRPAPFCILDEIEAALDDVNVVKYANYLHKMGDNTQFIMITHRRGSMEAADVLYGVTMQEEGISKLLQLKASEIESSNLLADLK